MVAVGGLSGRIYLMKCVREEFAGIVGEIASPSDPGNTICQGVAMWRVAKQNFRIARFCRKTYGMHTFRKFMIRDPLGYKWVEDDGVAKCDHMFFVFVQIGDAHYTITEVFTPCVHFHMSMSIEIFSSTKSSDAKYTKEDGAEEEGSSVLDMSSAMKLDKDNEVEVTMFFGRSSIEVTAEGKNFASGKRDCRIPVTYKRDSTWSMNRLHL